jgi:flagella synthesis protein FlgN
MSTVYQLIEQQINQLKTFNALMHSELDAFKERKPDTLVAIAEQKLALLKAITAIDDAISDATDLANAKEDKAFMDKVVECDILLNEIKIQNNINETVVQTSLNNVGKLKHSLLSLKNADTMTYNKAGKTKTQTYGSGIKA